MLGWYGDLKESDFEGPKLLRQTREELQVERFDRVVSAKSSIWRGSGEFADCLFLFCFIYQGHLGWISFRWGLMSIFLRWFLIEVHRHIWNSLRGYRSVPCPVAEVTSSQTSEAATDFSVAKLFFVFFSQRPSPVWVWVKYRYPIWLALVNEHMDKNLRLPGGLILTPTHFGMSRRVLFRGARSGMKKSSLINSTVGMYVAASIFSVASVGCVCQETLLVIVEIWCFLNVLVDFENKLQFTQVCRK